MLTSCALVLMMTIPGLALFYGGMVRVTNVLNTLMQCFSIVCLITVEWMVFGYSLGDPTSRCPVTLPLSPYCLGPLAAPRRVSCFPPLCAAPDVSAAV